MKSLILICALLMTVTIANAEGGSIIPPDISNRGSSGAGMGKKHITRIESAQPGLKKHSVITPEESLKNDTTSTSTQYDVVDRQHLKSTPTASGGVSSGGGIGYPKARK